MVVTLRDVSKFEPLLTSLLKSGATHIYGIRFRTTELRKHRDQVRTMAVTAAQEKAADMAKTLGRTVGKPIKVIESGARWDSSYAPHRDHWDAPQPIPQRAVQQPGPGSLSGEGAVAPGMISVGAKVDIIFELE